MWLLVLIIILLILTLVMLFSIIECEIGLGVISLILIGVTETLNNKMRLFRIPNYIVIAGILIVLALVSHKTIL